MTKFHKFIFLIMFYSISRLSSALHIPGVRKVVFLGTPSVAARSLQLLHEASLTSSSSDHQWKIEAVVTQPPQLMGRGKKRVLTQSPVGIMAAKLGIETHTPEKVNSLKDMLSDMQPDICITAAYGQYLPKRFLSTPKLGTLNIHPSLLPRWRGASPVQRSLEAGESETGVSVLWTVTAMDAGPIARQHKHILQGDEMADQVLDELFEVGTKSLIDLLPCVFDGSCSPERGVTIQQESEVTQAPKITIEESQVCFREHSAVKIHNRIRAFSDWPGVWTFMRIGDEKEDPLRIKLIQTRLLLEPHNWEGQAHISEIRIIKPDRMVASCADGSLLELLQLQQPSKRVMCAKDFINGLRGNTLSWVPREETDGHID